MTRRKRTSKRRWKARARAGRWIPKVAIVEHRLDRWFTFSHANYFSEFYRVQP